MTALAIALLATLPLGAAGWAAGALTDRLTAAPHLRERMWSLAFALPALAAAIPAVALLFPRAVAQGHPILLSTLLATGPVPPTESVAPAPAAIAWDAVLDHGPTVLAAIAVIGAVVGLAALALRHRALAAAVKTARPLEREDLARALAEQAARLRVAVPAILLSERVCTPVLVGLRRPSILLPAALAQMETERLALICVHELAHAKRNDNRRLLAEDLIRALLWFSPPQAAVHQRLVVAREEARDALALADAGPATRRRYAETLVEILRLGAGPGLKTAFIGAGRRGAVLRLKAILHPRGPASRRHRLLAGGLAVLLLSAAGAGSLALAAQVGPQEQTTSRISGGPTTGGVTVTSDYLEILPKGVLRWHGDPQVRFDRPGDAATAHALIDGLPAPVGFRPEAIDPKSLAWIEGRDGDKPMTLNFVRKGSDVAVRQAKYQGADARDYQRFCAAGDEGERGFCFGMIFGTLGKGGVCLPEGVDIQLAADRMIPVIAAARPAAGEPMKPFVLGLAKTAFPCPAEET